MSKSKLFDKFLVKMYDIIFKIVFISIPENILEKSEELDSLKLLELLLLSKEEQKSSKLGKSSFILSPHQ